MRLISRIVPTLCAAALIAFGDASGGGVALAQGSLPAGVSVDAIPPDAAEVAATVAAAKPGDSVKVRGRIGSTKDAFARGVAEFTLCDDAAASACVPKDGKVLEACPLPAASKVLVRIAGPNGKALGQSLEGKGGLKAGAEVFVIGKVASAEAGTPMVVLATGVHVPRGGLPVGFMTVAAPADAKDVSEARKADLKKGQNVVLRGVIGGGVDPFVAGRAMFTLMGTALKPCNANQGDGCKTPWDYCCETKTDILAHSVTVRVVDAKGNPLKTDMKGRWGIKEQSELIIVGSVATADKGVVVVNAISMHVVRP